MKRILRHAARIFLLAAGLVLLTEGALRLAGKPSGAYRCFYLEAPGFLYPPSEKILMGFGPVDYTLQTNALGFRGPELSTPKPPSTLRIMALGDSMVDGFFVDEADTYPRLLEAELRRHGLRAEVVNAASGIASIDKEFAILRRYAGSLNPDAAVLTFCTNDISDIRGRAPGELRGLCLPDSLPAGYAAERWWCTRTAVGETFLGVKLRLFYPSWRAFQDYKRGARGDRYKIDGGTDFQANVLRFRERFRATEGPLDTDVWSPEIEGAVRNYAELLNETDRYCRERGIRFLFVYQPSYPQIYDGSASLRIRDELEAACRRSGTPFLDLTPIFRENKNVLHLAPVDYHLNPSGNRLAADAVAAFLEKEVTVRS